MSPRHVANLTRVEIWRAKSLLGRLYLAGAAGLAIFFVIGKATDENILVVVMGVTLGATAVMPFSLMRDKLDRTLEFLLFLPVTVTDLVAARFLAAALGLLPGALATGLTSALVAPPVDFGPLAAIAPFQMALGFWVLLTLAAWWATAAAACELTRLIGWSVVAMVIFVGYVAPWGLAAIERTVSRGTFQSFLEQPYASVVMGTIAATITVALAIAAFDITRRGLGRYTARSEKPF